MYTSGSRGRNVGDRHRGFGVVKLSTRIGPSQKAWEGFILVESLIMILNLNQSRLYLGAAGFMIAIRLGSE